MSDFWIVNGELKKYLGSNKKVVVPDGVVSIGKAFAENDNLQKVIVPRSVKKIGKQAFFKCVNLKEVELCDGLEIIDNMAFTHCVRLTKIAIPSTVKRIGDSAFSQCVKLKTLELCEGLQVIDGWAFDNCCLKELVLPSTLTWIGSYSFARNDGLTLTLSNNLNVAQCQKNSLEQMFGVRQLSGIIIEKDIAFDPHILVYAFGKMKTYRNYSKYSLIGNIENVKTINDFDAPNDVFDKVDVEGKFHLAKLGLRASQTGGLSENIKKLVKRQGKKLLMYCIDNDDVDVLRGLISNSIPTKEHVNDAIAKNSDNPEIVALLLKYKEERFSTSPEAEMKAMMRKLERAVNPKEHVPTECQLLKQKWNFRKMDNGTLRITSYKGEEEKVVVPSQIGRFKVRTISNLFWAHYGCDDAPCVRSITIPASITKINDGAFSYGIKLSKITVDENNKHYRSIDGVLFDAAVTKLICFPRLKQCEQYVVPDTVEEIEDEAFYSAVHVKSVLLPSRLKTIGQRAFQCSRVREVSMHSHFGQTVKILGGAFANMYKLDIVEFDAQVSLSGDVFLDSNVKEAIFNGGCSEIAYCAFYNNPYLQQVTINCDKTNFNPYAFYSIKKFCMIAPKGSDAHKFAKQKKSITFKQI